jgi:hypothetical protein
MAPVLTECVHAEDNPNRKGLNDIRKIVSYPASILDPSQFGSLSLSQLLNRGLALSQVSHHVRPQSIPGHSSMEIYDSLEIDIMGNHSTTHLSSQIGALSNFDSTVAAWADYVVV